MATSMLVAKPEFSRCCLCANNIPVLHLIGVRGPKSKREDLFDKLKVILEWQLTESEKAYVCLVCLRKVNQFYAFREKAETSMRIVLGRQTTQTVATHKRFLHTPGKKPTPKRRKNELSIAEQLTKSVEKLRLSSHSDYVHPAEPEAETYSGNRSCRKRLQMTDHSYSKDLNTASTLSEHFDKEREAAQEVLKTSVIDTDSDKLKHTDHVSKIIEVVKTGDIQKLVKCLRSVPYLWKEIQKNFFQSIALERLNLLYQGSVHYKKDCDTLVNDHVFAKIVLEMKDKAPILLNILCVLFSSSKGKCLGTDREMATIATIAGMVTHSRDKHASIVQRLYTTVAIRCHADADLLHRLNKVHLTLNDKRSLMSTYGSHNDERIIQAVSRGQDGKINGDNLDLRVSTNDQRMCNKAKDYHFFASDWTPFRMQKTMSGTNTCGNPTNISVKTFTPSTQEVNVYRENLKILLARDLIDFKSFSWMKRALPDHIDHDFSEDMSTTSHPLIMPLLLCNEAKYEDCVTIMDSYTVQLHDWYTKAGRLQDLEGKQVPVGGDQLTRVRLQGAKLLRAGAHTSQERFDILDPIIVELFHTQMDFLQKMCKKFLNLKNARGGGTLAQLQILIGRSSVNGNVKSRFATHLEFVELLGRAYVKEAAMEYFGIDPTDGLPTLHLPPSGIEHAHMKRSKEAFNTVMDGFLDYVLGPASIDELTEDQIQMKLKITSGQKSFTTNVLSDGEKVEFQLAVGQKVFKISLKKSDLLQHGKCIVRIPGFSDVLVANETSQPDELENYVRNFLQWYFLLITFGNAIAEGDIIRTNIVLKMLLPYFHSHSSASKYLVECIDYIQRTEVLLPSHVSFQVRCASFVNMRGGQGKNVAADMEKEHQVKFAKGLIRGLGANKTERSIVSVCRAGPVILDVVQNCDRMMDHKVIKTTHKARPQDEELATLKDHIHKLKPFKTQPGRQLTGFKGIKSSVFVGFDKAKFAKDVMVISNRLKRNLTISHHESESETESDSE